MKSGTCKKSFFDYFKKDVPKNKKEMFFTLLDYVFWVIMIIAVHSFYVNNVECQFKLSESFMNDYLGLNFSKYEVDYYGWNQDELMERLLRKNIKFFNESLYDKYSLNSCSCDDEYLSQNATVFNNSDYIIICKCSNIYFS